MSETSAGATARPETGPTRSTRRGVSLRRHLLAAVAAVLLLEAGWELYELGDQYQRERNAAAEAQVQAGRAVARGIEARIAALGHSLSLVAGELEGLEDRGNAARRAYLARVLPRLVGADFLFYLDGRGTVRVAVPDGRLDVSLVDRPAVAEVLAGRRLWAVNPLVPSRMTGDSLLHVAHAVRGRRGEVTGVVLASVRGANLASWLGLAPLAADTTIVVMDSTGRVVHHDDHPVLDWEERDRSGAPDVREALAGRVVHYYIDPPGSAGRRRIGATVPLESLGWAVSVSRDAGRALASAYEQLAVQVAALVVLALVVAAFGFWIAGQLTSRLRALQAAAGAVGSGRLDARVAEADVEELNELGRAFNAMAGRLEAGARDAEKARRRAGFLAEASIKLNSFLDPEVNLGEVARLAVADIGDTCVVDLVGPDGSLRRVAAADRDPQRLARMRAVTDAPPSRGTEHPVARTIDSGLPVLLARAGEETLPASDLCAEPHAVPGDTAPGSVMVVPLLLRGRVLGSILFGRTADRAPYGEPDLELAEELARRAALALDNARLYREAQAAEQRYRDLVNGIDAVVWELDAATMEVRFVGARVEAILGYPVASWLGGPPRWLERLHHDDREETVQRLTRVIAEGVHQEHECRWLAADGRVVWLRHHAQPAMGAGGQVEAVRGVAFDVTARRAVAEERARLAALVENSSEFVGIGTLDGRLAFVNPAGLRLLGLASLDDVRDRPVAGLVPDEDRGRLEREIIPAVRAGEHRKGEFRLRHFGTGEAIPVYLIAFPILAPDTGEPVAVATMGHDLRDRKQLEEQLRQAQKMEVVGRLAGGIAHDFNNILTAITGYADLLLGTVPPDLPAHRDVEEIHKAAKRAAGLTRQLLAFSRKQVFQARPLDLNAAVADMQTMLRRLIGEDVELKVALSPDPCPVKADPVQIEQVVMNLAVNARQAMPHGGVLTIETARMDLDESAARRQDGLRQGPYVRLVVRDTGVGMDEDTLAHVFEPFFTTKERGKGTGLGLATVYGIVRQSGGAVQVESAPGRGATFSIYLPRRVDEAVEAPAPRPAAPSGGAETILLVEDEEMVRDLARESLRRKGYAVLEAASGQEALALATRHDGPIHLLLTDVVMPGMKGPEVAARLAPLRPHARVLYMSGYTEDALGEQGAVGPETAFIEKPFTPDALARKVREVLAGISASGPTPATAR